MKRKNKEEIKKLALHIDHNLAFGGKSKGNKHLYRVVKIAHFLAKEIGADVDITVAGAFLHDTALPSGNDYEYERNKKIIRKLLKTLELSRAEKNAIAECVASHEGTTAPKTLEAQIVHDADALDKTGLLGLIRHTWKMTNFKHIDPFAVNAKDARHILSHIAWRQKKLQTPLARKIAKYVTVPMKIGQAEELIAIVAVLAHKGVITEKIAVALRPHLTKQQNKKLTEQLQVRYLNRFK